jgi:LysR family nitrogen assimilation transcriptional regulator
VDIRQLRTFIQVAEMRSINRAAAALHIAQPALSRQIKLLEEELGDRLFARNERGVSLTPFGEEMLQRSVDVVRDFDALRSDLSRRSGALTGHVRFGVPKTLMEHFVAPALADFHKVHPGVSMLVMDGTTLELRELVRAGGLDLAIVSDLDRSASARLQPLLREPLVLVAPPGSGLRMDKPVSARVVARHSLVTTFRPNIIRLTLDDAMLRAGQAAEVSFETSSHTAIRILAAKGDMYGVMPYSGVSLDVDAGRLTAAPIVGAVMSWNFASTPLRELPRAAVALRQYLSDAALVWVRSQPCLHPFEQA